MTFTYLGLQMQQQPRVIAGFSTLLQSISPAQIIEFGTGRGGFTVFLAIYGFNRCQVTTFENKLRADSTVQELLDRLQVRVIQADIFSRGWVPQIASLIRQDGISLVLCDNGDKRREVQLFAPYLKPGDVIMAHDYYGTRERAGVPFEGKGSLELVYEDIREVCAMYNLLPYMQDVFQPLRWFCGRRD